jgi:prevent-host-death family protein
MSMDTRTVPAGQFKQGCLALLEQVASERCEIVITKRGKPVARVVPMATDDDLERQALANLKGTARLLVEEEEFLAPLGEEAGWDLGEES